MTPRSRFIQAKALAFQFGFRLELIQEVQPEVRPTKRLLFLTLTGNGQYILSHGYLLGSIARYQSLVWVQQQLLEPATP